MEVKSFQIVFEDEYLIVVDKRSGLLVVPTPDNEKHTLTSLLNEYLAAKKEQAYPCHRLDRGTSGLIIYAKTKKAEEAITAQFKAQSLRKKYLAIVQKRVIRSRAVIKGYIKPKGKPEKFAVTKFKVLRRFKKFSILEVEPKTGRTNQIRIQLNHIGHPVVGERKYVVARLWPIKSKRLCLHAYFLQFRHPESKDLVTLTIDIPQDIKNLLESLGVELKLAKIRA